MLKNVKALFNSILKWKDEGVRLLPDNLVIKIIIQVTEALHFLQDGSMTTITFSFSTFNIKSNSFRF